MKKLYRKRQGGMIAGICNGLADYFQTDVTVVRLAAVVFAFISCGTAVLFYLVACIIVPAE